MAQESLIDDDLPLSILPVSPRRFGLSRVGSSALIFNLWSGAGSTTGNHISVANRDDYSAAANDQGYFKKHGSGSPSSFPVTSPAKEWEKVPSYSSQIMDKFEHPVQKVSSGMQLPPRLERHVGGRLKIGKFILRAEPTGLYFDRHNDKRAQESANVLTGNLHQDTVTSNQQRHVAHTRKQRSKATSERADSGHRSPMGPLLDAGEMCIEKIGFSFNVSTARHKPSARTTSRKTTKPLALNRKSDTSYADLLAQAMAATPENFAVLQVSKMAILLRHINPEESFISDKVNENKRLGIVRPTRESLTPKNSLVDDTAVEPCILIEGLMLNYVSSVSASPFFASLRESSTSAVMDGEYGPTDDDTESNRSFIMHENKSDEENLISPDHEADRHLYIDPHTGETRSRQERNYFRDSLKTGTWASVLCNLRSLRMDAPLHAIDSNRTKLTTDLWARAIAYHFADSDSGSSSHREFAKDVDSDSEEVPEITRVDDDRVYVNSNDDGASQHMRSVTHGSSLFVKNNIGAKRHNRIRAHHRRSQANGGSIRKEKNFDRIKRKYISRNELLSPAMRRVGSSGWASATQGSSRRRIRVFVRVESTICAVSPIETVFFKYGLTDSCVLVQSDAGRIGSESQKKRSRRESEGREDEENLQDTNTNSHQNSNSSESRYLLHWGDSQATIFSGNQVRWQRHTRCMDQSTFFDSSSESVPNHAQSTQFDSSKVRKAARTRENTRSPSSSNDESTVQKVRRNFS